MAKITAKPKRPALGHFADWIRPLRLADELPALANRRVRARSTRLPCPVIRRRSRRGGPRPPPITTTGSVVHRSSVGCGYGGSWTTRREAASRDGAVWVAASKRVAPPAGTLLDSDSPGGRPRRQTAGFRSEPALGRGLWRSSRLGASLLVLRRLQGAMGGDPRSRVGGSAAAHAALGRGVGTKHGVVLIQKARGRRLPERFRIVLSAM